MVSFFAEVKILRFWPKTMDYNKAFWPKSRSFFEVILLLTGRCYEAATKLKSAKLKSTKLKSTKLKSAPFCSP